MKKEYKFLNYFCMHSFFLGIGLSRILTNTKEMFFLAIILGTILGIIILKLMNISMQKRPINVLISSTLFVISLVVVSNMISTMYLTEMPKILVCIPMILTIIYIISKEEKVMFRITNILIVINSILYIIAISSLLSHIKLINYAYTNTKIKDIIISSLEFAILSTTPCLISKDERHKDITIIKTYIISSIAIFAIFTITLGVLGPEMVSVYRYPEYIILKKITLFNNTSNIENIICFYWIFEILMFLTACANRIKHIIGFKKTTCLLTILLLLTSYFNNDYIYIVFIYKYTYIILAGCLILLYLFNRKRLKT